VRPRLDPTRRAVNVRCSDDVDLGTLRIGLFNGKNLDEAARALVAATQKQAAT